MAHQKNTGWGAVMWLAMATGGAIAALGAPVIAAAQVDAEKSAQIMVSIPAQRLAESLRQLAEVSGLQLVYDAKVVEGKSAPAVSGSMTRSAALGALLSGSGVRYQFSGDRTVILTAGTANGARAVGVVSVNGVSRTMPFEGAVTPVNGVNGSRDVEATEGTGSYTTGATSIVSKIPLPMRDIPQSVSVMTAQQMRDQNLVSAKEVMEKMAGVTVAPGANGEEFDIYSRGFGVTSFSFDGGAVSTFNHNNRPVLNMSEFDSVQLIRGAAGLFGGYNDPGGVVNLVRKKPLDHNQITYEQNIGSWSNFREVLDVTGPLTEDGKLRGRAVYSQQDRKFYYDVADSHKQAMYGVLEYDLARDTLLTFGASYNKENNTPNQGGLPRYSNGEAIDWPVNTCLCVPFAHDRARKTEAFVGINHDINDDWSVKLNYTYTKQVVDGLYFGISSLIDKGGSTEAYLGGFGSVNPLKQSTLDLVTTGKFKLLGLEQSIVLGGNVQNIDNTGGTTTFSGSYPTVAVPNVFQFDPYAYSEPANPGADYWTIKNRTLMYGLYGNLRLAPIENLHVSVGMRYSTLRQALIQGYKGVDAPEVLPLLRDKSRSKPNFGITYDFLDNFTVYGSYQATYQPQVYARYVSASFIPPPITGVNKEIGLKWQSPDHKLNAALSIYDITQNGLLMEDYASEQNGIASSYLPLVMDSRSHGVDLEVSGEVARGWQASVSYAYNINSVVSASGVAPKTSYTPRNMLKTWITRRGSGEGFAGRLIVGGGVNYQSHAYTAGYVCNASDSTPQHNCIEYGQFDFVTKGYTTLAAKIGYQVNKNVEVSLKLDNITNVKSYAASQYQSVAGYNFYIAPFNVMATLNAKW